MSGRVILHSDLNSFYASVECMLEPSLRGKPVAVCGSTETRHGIVLAKSEPAKRAGVKTGMANWEARQQCPGLITLPPQYEQYLKYSRLVRAIYRRYTELVEPFGMDECWLDVTGTRQGGPEAAEEIRRTVREELGLTVSIGVSFNKIFAKLGSDMKKPDAVTVIDEENFRTKIWPLSADELIYVGRSTVRTLRSFGIYTIGDLAAVDPEFLRRRFGKGGPALWVYANGLDASRVMPCDFEAPVKSVGHGITCTEDLPDDEAVWRVTLELAQDVGHRLRAQGLSATGVQITVRDNGLAFRQYQALLRAPTQSPFEIASLARRLFEYNYDWKLPVRAMTVRAINLVETGAPQQLNLYSDAGNAERRARLDAAVDDLRSRFGAASLCAATLLDDVPIRRNGAEKVKMPNLMYS